MTHQIDRSGGEGEIMTISNVIHIGLSIQLSISGRAMPEAEPYFEALRQSICQSNIVMRRFWMATRTTSDVARLCPIGTRLPSFEVPSAPQLARSPSSECSAAFRIPYKGEGGKPTNPNRLPSKHTRRLRMIYRKRQTRKTVL
jgi:hypothetical protein